MPRRTQPRQGSMQFWPRKRAKRIYPRTRHWPESKDVKPLGFAGFKAGMTHVLLVDSNVKSPTYGKSIIKPVTIIDSPSLFCCGYRLYSRNPSESRSLGSQWPQNLPRGLKL